ncbi:regulator of G-protein signaling 21-like [Sphaeramia orbicularis]|uniref:regulator of G-protein signaling 21-like n=1 Tax=Sphaeramia orbicularis TaxID=375764 RepID=UPI00117F6CF4|nr:regulator of G-protein signaling 21-like [Sphaeramia orbicularis]
MSSRHCFQAWQEVSGVDGGSTTSRTLIPECSVHILRAPVVATWGESLDQLLECKTGQLVFENFLRTEYSEENLLFWLACEDYKKITNETEMTVAASRIYKEFVQVDAPRQINIDCGTREEISENISQPGPNCFNRAQRLIYGLMENDCYPRFLKSEIYQTLLEQAE